MKLFRQIILAILIATAILFCTHEAYFTWNKCGISPIVCADYSPLKTYETLKIGTGQGPEDMALDKNGNSFRLIISCSSRRGEQQNGGFYALEIDSDRSYPLSVIPTDIEIQPHGISIATMDSTKWLYAISHDVIDDQKVDRILRFELKDSLLLHDDQFELRDSLLQIPNDLHVLENGTMYVSNYLKKGTFVESLLSSMGKKTGDIVYYDTKGQWHKVIDNLCFPNGIYVDEESHQLYFANGGCKELIRVNLRENGQIISETWTSTIDSGQEIIIGDNLLIGENGYIWVTSHPCTLKFSEHSQDAKNLSPTQVFKVDKQSMIPELAYQNNGKQISGGSTAIYLDSRIYISQVFEPFILRVQVD